MRVPNNPGHQLEAIDGCLIVKLAGRAVHGVKLVWVKVSIACSNQRFAKVWENALLAQWVVFVRYPSVCVSFRAVTNGHGACSGQNCPIGCKHGLHGLALPCIPAALAGVNLHIHGLGHFCQVGNEGIAVNTWETPQLAQGCGLNLNPGFLAQLTHRRCCGFLARLDLTTRHAPSLAVTAQELQHCASVLCTHHHASRQFFAHCFSSSFAAASNAAAAW